ncbi:37632_t:CDS:2 [Gigaspora margarita]|uniref:37632_t:CDS:1 n=1 Tax=Gigaspora margarita TaxID=4874 RepID=A0ABN7WFQ3_GIGMA|nr:37632_t:CDS:2 [Gigaspora margarita]
MYKLSSEIDVNIDDSSLVGNFNLNDSSLIGTTIERQKAFESYLKSAKYGNADAIFELANFCINGISTSIYMTKALELYLKSESKNFAAQLESSNCYKNGTGIEIDKVFELYLKFAENENAAAIYELTNCYAIGTRTDKNYERTFE